MRKIYFVIVIIALLGLGYVGFSILTFEPDRVNPIAFQDTSITLEDGNEETKDNFTSPEIEASKARAAEIIISAIKSYEQQWQALPKQTEPLSNLFFQLIKRGKLPTHYPLLLPEGEPIVPKILNVNANAVIEIDPEVTSNAACNPQTSLLIGAAENDNIVCPESNGKFARLFATGPGDDVIVTGNSTALIDAGLGNDRIRTGPGVSLIFFHNIEGNDIVEIDCENSNMRGRSLSDDYPLPWIYPYKHFIVMGSQVNKNELVIGENEIRDPVGGGKISITGNCFNLIFAGQ